MKKILVLAILLTSFSDIFANATQGNWRWRNDDGSETTATWKAAQNVAPTITSNSDVLRLRIELYNNKANDDKGAGALDSAILQFSTDQINWDTIHVVSDGDDPFVLAGSSPNVTDKQPTTGPQLANSHITPFEAGQVIVSTDPLPKKTTVSDGKGTEFEYAIKPTADLQPSTTYYFRLFDVILPTGLVLPSLKTAAALPIRLSSFNIKKEGTKIKLEWSTSSEQNNDRFEIERSNNANDWKAISTVKGNGTTNETHNYDSYDEAPANGINYYRLRQVDFDGHSVLTEIKSLKFDGNQDVVVTVSPNPATNGVNFKLDNVSATNVSVSLTNSNGVSVYREVIGTVDAGSIYRLNMSQQPAGVYILNLKSKDIQKSVKVVIQ